MSPFERFFAEDFRRLLETCRIPAEAWTTPPANPASPQDVSWDRRAAWLLFNSGATLVLPPAAVAPVEEDPFDGY